MTRSHSAPEAERVSNVGWSSVTNDHSRGRRVTADCPCLAIVSCPTARDTQPMTVESGSFHPVLVLRRRAESRSPPRDSSSRSRRSGWIPILAGAGGRTPGLRARTEWLSAHPGRPRDHSRTAATDLRGGRSDWLGAARSGRILRRQPCPADTRANRYASPDRASGSPSYSASRASRVSCATSGGSRIGQGTGNHGSADSRRPRKQKPASI